MKCVTTIHVLDDATINKIAAGEVVERPASVIKELVENSMDAGATKIEVETMAGGTSFMRVTDDGKGMTEEDARLAIQRHATSKIREARDLENIATLGFRGEALPTIASVSRFLLQTRPKDMELGTRVSITGGKDTELRETGCALGTTIQVEDLFFNTPARKKFLKTTHTEGLKISDFLTKLALSRPDIAFRYISNNKLSIVTPGNGNLYDTIEALYGKLTANALLALHFEAEELKVTGFITKPSMLKGSRSWQTFIVNGRTVQSRALSKALDNAYKAMIPKSGYPFAVLFIEVPQRTIDVNVHPQKTEMKFEDESRVFKGVYKAVLDAVRPQDQGLGEMAAHVERPERFAQTSMEFVPASVPMEKEPETSSQGTFSGIPVHTSAMSDAMSSLEENTTEKVLARDFFIPLESRGANEIGTGQMDFVAEAREEASPAGEALSYEGGISPIGQVDLTYIIAQDRSGLYIVDQHAAHERILFDRLSSRAEAIPAQQLLVHLLLPFDERESRIIEEHKELFSHMGFTMEAVGDTEYRLMEVPADIPVTEAEDAIREILVALEEHTRISPKDIRQQCIATTACRAAIKAGQELNFRQMQILLEELAHTDFPYTCPHGRPTILKFSTGELAKMFKRTGFDF